MRLDVEEDVGARAVRSFYKAGIALALGVLLLGGAYFYKNEQDKNVIERQRQGEYDRDCQSYRELRKYYDAGGTEKPDIKSSKTIAVLSQWCDQRK